MLREHTQLIIECNIFCIECARCTRSSFLPFSFSLFSLARGFFSLRLIFFYFFFTPLESKPIKNAKRNQPGIPLLFFSAALTYTQTYYVNLSTLLYRPQNRFNFHGINIVRTFSFSILHFALGRKRPRIDELVSLFLCSLISIDRMQEKRGDNGTLDWKITSIIHWDMSLLRHQKNKRC